MTMVQTEGVLLNFSFIFVYLHNEYYLVFVMIKIDHIVGSEMGGWGEDAITIVDGNIRSAKNIKQHNYFQH